MNSAKTGLYVHIPFCVRKCAYCDFVSYEGISSDIKEKYVEALLRDMSEYKGETIDTIYLGGGTPTTLDLKLIEKLMAKISDVFDVEDDSEITIECNPKTADLAYFNKLREYGFNRISIGVQSLDDSELEFLGRVHDSREAITCIEQAKRAGFDNFNIDVMFGLPNQSTDSVRETLETLLSLSPSHISCYSLMIEEGTPFYEKGVMTLDDEKEREMQAFIVEFLEKNGFCRYEISNFARDGRISRHNMKYWEGIPYIGIGAASSSYYNGERYEKNANIYNYINNPLKKENLQTITREDEMSEFMFLGLRKTEGVSLSEFYDRFGTGPEDVYDIEKSLKLGLLVKEGDRLRLSEKGIDVSNAVLCDFV